MLISNILHYKHIPFFFCPWEMSDEITQTTSFHVGFEKIYTNNFKHTTVDLVTRKVMGEKPTLK